MNTSSRLGLQGAATGGARRHSIRVLVAGWQPSPRPTKNQTACSAASPAAGLLLQGCSDGLRPPLRLVGRAAHQAMLHAAPHVAARAVRRRRLHRVHHQRMLQPAAGQAAGPPALPLPAAEPALLCCQDLVKAHCE